MYLSRGQLRIDSATMLQLVLSLLGLIIIAPVAIPIAIAILGISFFCLAVTVVAISLAISWDMFKNSIWILANTAIDSTPFLLEREQNTAHEYLNLFFGYARDCHKPERATPTPHPTTPLKPHLANGMTSQEWMSRNASIASLTTCTARDLENADSWINDEDDCEALYMARRSSIVQPSFDAPVYDTPRSRRASKAGSPEASRPPSRAPTPSTYTGFADSMRPPSRNGSGFFNSSPVTPLRGYSATSATEFQYFQIQPTSPISLHGRRPSWSPMMHRRNNQSTTSFGSVPEEMTEERTDGGMDEIKS
ncbi:hypothetical protein M409DRAFT_28760 [Zasmidium cellare ATCC 36951]|uniref:Uncharacterized protein n=1 Tax=Zasmidium cellare ATCC 36951 TaxID=1080233 RepID=A0A6A6C3W8_ZASCE|nr:uncharacterized protein M409DRAFT_28760 [Zasmidium cellare ATCC 36951]KAF2160880.1 hypothetical protein M409DRAFT_28760 [Zasmidium cellare ATCC 36951]